MFAQRFQVEQGHGHDAVVAAVTGLVALVVVVVAEAVAAALVPLAPHHVQESQSAERVPFFCCQLPIARPRTMEGTVQ